MRGLPRDASYPRHFAVASLKLQPLHPQGANRFLLSTAFRRGLIEADTDQTLTPHESSYPRHFAVASLKRENGMPFFFGSANSYPRHFAVASLKQR